MLDNIHQQFEELWTVGISTNEIELSKEFHDLAEQWDRETGMLSFISQRDSHPAYQRIIEMGEKALPLILRRLQTEPDHWFPALRAIINKNPIPSDAAGDFERMREIWLEWGRKNR